MKAGAGADAPARADGDSDGLISRSFAGARRRLLADVAPDRAGVTGRPSSPWRQHRSSIIIHRLPMH